MEHLTPALILAVASAPYRGPDAPCSWDSVDPLVKIMLQAVAEEHLRVSIPVLIAHGWTKEKL